MRAVVHFLVRKTSVIAAGRKYFLGASQRQTDKGTTIYLFRPDAQPIASRLISLPMPELVLLLLFWVSSLDCLPVSKSVAAAVWSAVCVKISESQDL